MDELERLVEKLEQESAKEKPCQDKQIKILQEINHAFLTQYVIKLDDLIIRPLWVEAYYYHKDKFADCNSHKNSRQMNHFGQLYFHEVGYGGLDICLSRNENYYLSFLLKATEICCKGQEKGEIKIQTEIYDILKILEKTEADLEAKDNIIVPQERSVIVRDTIRKGLTKKSYKNEQLASVAVDKVKNCPRIKLPTGYCKTKLISEYICERLKENPSEDEVYYLKQLASGLIKWKNFKET